MDELEAAAAVLATSVHSESDEEMELEVMVHKPNGPTASAPMLQPSTEDKENYSDLPVDRPQGAEDGSPDGSRRTHPHTRHRDIFKSSAVWLLF